MAEASDAAEAATLLPGLPDEIAIWEILVGLPPESIIRCRAVSPAWRRATSNRNFLLAHHTRQPNLPLLEGSGCLDIVPFDHQAASDHLKCVARLQIPGFHLQASCDGLLLLSDRNRQYAICNPTTRQYRLLPQIRGFTLLGMYPHGSTSEYRLLLYPGGLLSPVWQRNRKPEDVDACHVFTLGSSQPPRKINIGWPNPEYSTHELVGVLLHGKLHWHQVRQDIRSNIILVFDTTDQLFQQMPSPVPVPRHGVLFEMDGMLCVYAMNDAWTSMDIWVLEDYESKIWAFKCRVEFPVEEIKVFGSFCPGRLAVASWHDKVHVMFQSGKWLLQIDVDGKLVASFRRKQLLLTPLWLKQTLVPHTFFPALKGYIVNRLPFI
jgi:F-box interacting protein